MPGNEFSWKNSENFDIVAREWKPLAHTRAVIIIVHGLGEHSQRYDYTARHFNDHGFAVIAFDLQGHGKSGGMRGYASFQQSYIEIDRAIKEAKSRYPNTPVFLYGHSLGASLVLIYAAQRKPMINGLIASAPCIRTAKPITPIKIAVGRTSRYLVPTLALGNGLDRDGLSRDTSIVRAYNEDPLVHDRVTAQLGTDLIDSGFFLLEHAHEFSTPCLLMQGSADRIVDPDSTYEFAKRAPSTTSFKKWEGLYHELHNEPEKNEVLQFVESWINKQVG